MNVWPLSQAGWVLRSRARKEASDVSPYDIRPLSPCLVRAGCSRGLAFPLPDSFTRKVKKVSDPWSVLPRQLWLQEWVLADLLVPGGKGLDH